MSEYDFHQDFEMVRRALTSEAEEVRMRNLIRPFVDSSVDHYVAIRKITDIPRNELFHAAWFYFGQALRGYSAQIKLMVEGQKKPYKFNDYFHWYIKQGMLEHIIKKRDKTQGIAEKKFDSELEMIREAPKSEAAEQKIRKYYYNFVEECVDQYLAKNNIQNHNKLELVSAGFTYLNMALNHYLNKEIPKMRVGLKEFTYFDKYFHSFVTRGIEEYLHTLK